MTPLQLFLFHALLVAGSFVTFGFVAILASMIAPRERQPRSTKTREDSLASDIEQFAIDCDTRVRRAGQIAHAEIPFALTETKANRTPLSLPGRTSAQLVLWMNLSCPTSMPG